MSDTNIVYQARLHWILFSGPVALFVFATFIGLRFPLFYDPSFIVMIFAVIWGLMVWSTYRFSSLTIKKKQIILRTGLLVRNTLDISLNKIESIDIRQSVLGSILQYGSIVITGTGGSRQMVHYLSKPLTCRRYIEELLHE